MSLWLAIALLAAPREVCVSIGGVGVISPTVKPGDHLGVYGPITKCSLGQLRVTFVDEVEDECGTLVGSYEGQITFDNKRSTSDTWVVGTNVDVALGACFGQASVRRTVYVHGDRVAGATTTVEVVKP